MFLDSAALGVVDGASWGVGDLARELRGLGALALLVLLPGLVLVRARWTAVPSLSLSFWIASWWWLGLLDVGRRRFILATLAGFLILAGLRVLRPWRAPRPSLAALAVLAGAVALGLPYLLEPVPSGADGSFRALQALLMVWRDGMPSSYEPLLPAAGFGASPPGLPGLAADVSLLSGLPAYRATVLVSLAARGLLVLSLFALLRPRGTAVAAVASTSAVVSAAWLQRWLYPAGDVPSLAVALVAASATVVSGGGGHRGLAAGVLFGAAVVSDPVAAAAGGLAAALLSGGAGSIPRNRSGCSAVYWGSLAAVLVAGPFLWKLAPALAAGNVSLGDAALIAALAAVPVPLAGGLVALSRELAVRDSSKGALRRGRGPALAAALLACALTGASRGARWGRAPHTGGDDLRAMSWLARHARQSDVVCNLHDGPAVWIPAVAGRAVTRPHLAGPFPPSPRADAHRCVWVYASAIDHGRVAFESGTVRILDARPAASPEVTTFDTPPRNLVPSSP